MGYSKSTESHISQILSWYLILSQNENLIFIEYVQRTYTPMQYSDYL